MQRISGCHGRRLLGPEIDLSPASRQLAPQRCEAIIGVDDCDPVRLEFLEQFALGARNRFFGTQELHVRVPGVVDERHIGRGKPSQVANLFSVIHSHFDHRVAMLRLEFEQHQRHADVVVQVSPGGEHAGIAIGIPG
ncbi:hypothetical protein D3C83_16060 [compost metagenome]